MKNIFISNEILNNLKKKYRFLKNNDHYIKKKLKIFFGKNIILENNFYISGTSETIICNPLILNNNIQCKPLLKLLQSSYKQNIDGMTYLELNDNLMSNMITISHNVNKNTRGIYVDFLKFFVSYYKTFGNEIIPLRLEHLVDLKIEIFLKSTKFLKNIKFEYQKKIDKYYCDIVFPELKIIIEFNENGSNHNLSKKNESKRLLLQNYNYDVIYLHENHFLNKKLFLDFLNFLSNKLIYKSIKTNNIYILKIIRKISHKHLKKYSKKSKSLKIKKIFNKLI